VLTVIELYENVAVNCVHVSASGKLTRQELSSSATTTTTAAATTTTTQTTTITTTMTFT
jgi:hypothetical protein